MKKMTEEQKLYFLYGAMYQMAKDMKNEGLFEDLNISQIIGLIINDLPNK